MPVKIPTLKLLDVCDPFTAWNWASGPTITQEEVQSAITNLLLAPKMKDSDFEQLTFEERRKYHIERIAFLVVNGWNDAISIDVGVPQLWSYPNWIVTDGNHRFAAAIFRKEEWILATVDGSIEYARELFGIDVTEPSFVNSR
jgi:hypothetical protein